MKARAFSSPESLEPRIAPAAVFKFTDVDGDLVTVKTNKGVDANLATAGVVVLQPVGLGFQLQTINFSLYPDIFGGTNLTVTAKRTASGGDGLVNVGRIDATAGDGDGTALDLGAIKIAGDLGDIDAGTASPSTPAVKSLSAHSMGLHGLVTQNGAGDLACTITGRLGALNVTTDVKDVFLNGIAGIGPVNIGGSLRGGAADESGTIVSGLGNIGPVKIGGDIVGGDGLRSGAVSAAKKLGAVTVGGSVIGGTKADSGRIFSVDGIGAVTIGGDLRGAGAVGQAAAGSVYTNVGSIASITVKGDVTGGVGEFSGIIVAGLTGPTGKIGPVKIGGMFQGGLGQSSGRISCGLTIASVTIGQSVVGGSGTGQFTAFISATGDIGPVSIRGDLKGGAEADSGFIFSANGNIASVKIGGSVIGGAGFSSGALGAASVLGPVTIGGDLVGGSSESSGSIGAGAATSIKIAGSLIGGSKERAGSIQSEAVNTLIIGGDVIGGTAEMTGMLSIGTIFGEAKNVRIGGSVIGGSANKSGWLNLLLSKKIVIGHDLRGGDAFGPDVADSGAISSATLGSIVIGGSIISGKEFGVGDLTRSGAIVSNNQIDSLVVKGSLIGNDTQPVTIFTRGAVTPTATSDVAIGSVTVGGNVERAWIFGGVDKDGVGINGPAQIGPVKVGGDWIASNLVTGATTTDGKFGDANDDTLPGAAISRIASITISGQVLGEPGTNETFGFFAHRIGAFKVNGVAIPLTSGAGNDTFATGQAHAVGTSLSTINADGFAVHVFEV